MSVEEIMALFPQGTSRQVAHATIAAARGAVRLEGLGMRHSSGRSVRKHWTALLNLPARTPASEVFARLDEALETLKLAPR